MFKKLFNIQKKVVNETIIYPEATLFMLPQSKMKVLYHGMNNNEILDVFYKTQYSILPVCEKNKDTISGCYSIFNALKHHRNNQIINLYETLLVNFMISSTPIDYVIPALATQNTMIVLTDEHGATEGIITSEILMNKLYQIPTEFKMQELIIDGKTSIDKILSILKISGDYDAKTCGGFITEYLDRTPDKNEKISIGHYDIMILDVNEFCQVTKIQLRPNN